MSRKENARRLLDLLEAQFPILSMIIPLEELKSFISTCRSIISNPQVQKWKKWPDTEAIEIKLVYYEPFFKNWVKTVIDRDADPHNQEIMVLKDTIRKNLLEWPKAYHDSYDDLHPKLDKDGKPMMKRIEWRHWNLEERRRMMREGSSSDLVDNVMEWLPEKKEEQLYNKYVKEWNKND